jgi:hypothetical protein
LGPRPERLRCQLVRRRVGEISGEVDPPAHAGDPARALRQAVVGRGVEHDLVDARRGLFLRLPARGAVRAEHRAFDDRASLLVEGEGERVVQQPGQCPADVRDPVRDGGGGCAQCVCIDLLFLPDPGHDDVPCVQLTVGVQDDGRSEVALELAAVGEALQPAVELSIELAGAVRERALAVPLGIGHGYEVGLAFSRLLDLDCELPHRVAIVSELQGFTVSLRNPANRVQL